MMLDLITVRDTGVTCATEELVVSSFRLVVLLVTVKALVSLSPSVGSTLSTTSSASL